MSAVQPPYRFTHEAMACTFGLTLVTDNAEHAQQVAWAAFDEIDRLEQLLSRFVPHSDIAQLNRAAPGQLVRLSAETLECLQLATELHRETGGAFDIAFRSRKTADADSPVLAFDPAAHAVAVTRPGVELDLGGLGKGYALDGVAEIVRTWGVAAALVDSGQSTVLAVGTPAAEEAAWRVALRHPDDAARVLGRVRLCDAALAGSGQVLHGPHIVDPRSGQPIARVAAWAVAPSAAVADALSTAFAILADEPGHIAEICGRRGVSGILADREGDPPGLRCIPPDGVALESTA